MKLTNKNYQLSYSDEGSIKTVKSNNKEYSIGEFVHTNEWEIHPIDSFFLVGPVILAVVNEQHWSIDKLKKVFK